MREKNRKTLVRSITRTTRLCIFLAITVFTATISFMSVHLTKQNGSFFAGLFANTIAHRITSSEFLEHLGIEDISSIKHGSAESNRIYQAMKSLEENTYNYYLVDSANGIVVSIPALRELHEFFKKESLKGSNIETLGQTSFNEIAQARIVINGEEVFRSAYWDRLPPDMAEFLNTKDASPVLQNFLGFFRTESTYFISNSSGESIGQVQVRLNSMFNLSFYVTLLAGIISAALASFIASLILTSFFTKNVAKPVVVLDKNLNYLAEGNYDELLNSHIHVKKPLKEIESIAESTNLILDKMHEFNKVISSQNELLEKLNNELEAQNEELMESREQIHKAQTQLVQNQNMASVGQLTAAISHEINTPLGTINSNVQLQNMILDMLLSNPEVLSEPELMETIIKMRDSGSMNSESCNQVSLIIRSLKNFSRLDQADFQEADINESARSVVLLTRHLWRNRIEMHEDYGSLPHVKCYPGLLNQVFMNILVNAIKAIPDTGHIYIRTWTEKEYVCASIKDTGAGIPKNKLKSIFENNYAYKDFEKTTSLGLTICKSIIDKHHGAIEGKSDPGKGSEFIFRLPVN